MSYSKASLDYTSSPQTSTSQNNLSSCSTENSNLKLPSKYLNRRKVLHRQKTFEDLKSQGVHSNSQPTINPAGVYQSTPEKSKMTYSRSEVSTSQILRESVSNMDKCKALDLVKTQLGLNFILIDLCGAQTDGILGQAKYELVQELKQKKKLAFVMGIEESQLNAKISLLVEKQQAEYKAQITQLKDELQMIKDERDQLKAQLSHYLDQTLRLSGNLLSQTFESQLSITELDMSRQSSIAQLNLNCEASDSQSVTLLESFMSDFPALDGKIPQLKAIQDYISKTNSNSRNNQQVPTLTQEQKQQQMIAKNRDALLKKYLMVEHKEVDIEESREYITPVTNPPNACTVILESFISNNLQDNLRTQFPKLQFTNRDNTMTRINDSTMNPLSSGRLQTNVQEYYCSVQSSNDKQNMSQSSDELSMLQEEIPIASMQDDLRRVKHLYLKK